MRPFQRLESHLWAILLFSFVYNVPVKHQRHIQIDKMQRDMQLCPHCFDHQYDGCMHWLQKLSDADDIVKLVDTLIVSRLSFRNIQYLQLSTDNQIVLAKSYAALSRSSSSAMTFQKQFQENAERGGFNYCPAGGTPSMRIVNYFESEGCSESTIRWYMLTNITPMLMPVLHRKGLPVPATYAVCGSTIYQACGEVPLSSYSHADMSELLFIARQILKLALDFTHGFDDFRIYLTDLTADNLVYNQASGKLTLVDIDSIVMVDTKLMSDGAYAQWKRHEPIVDDEADGFAFVPKEFCTNRFYDVNIYQACVFLNRSFLKDYAPECPHLIHLLTVCISCQAPCKNRLALVPGLLQAADDCRIAMTAESVES